MKPVVIESLIWDKTFQRSIRIIKILFVSLRPIVENKLRTQNTLRDEFNECS